MKDSATGDRVIVRNSDGYDVPYLMIDPEQEAQVRCLSDGASIKYVQKQGAITLGDEPVTTVIVLLPEDAENAQKLLDTAN